MARRTRLAHTPTKPPRHPVTTTTPDPLAWRRAMRLARGDVSRLVVLSPTEVLVTRRPA